jgi:hypothetical protein
VSSNLKIQLHQSENKALKLSTQTNPIAIISPSIEQDNFSRKMAQASKSPARNTAQDSHS